MIYINNFYFELFISHDKTQGVKGEKASVELYSK